jgi:hypothetical protein
MPKCGNSDLHQAAFDLRAGWADINSARMWEDTTITDQWIVKNLNQA